MMWHSLHAEWTLSRRIGSRRHIVDFVEFREASRGEPWTEHFPLWLSFFFFTHSCITC